MADLFDYIYWRGDLTFEQDRFGEVDGMILSRLAYIPFELAPEVMSRNGATVADAADALLSLPDIEKLLSVKDDAALLEALGKSRRFGQAELSRYESRVDTISQTQFAAVTMRLGENLNCIAFRGTDNTLVGWKEDFNMGFIFPVPSQKLALEYVESVIPSMTGDFVLCGHSKGGNLSVYASAFCKHLIQNRIAAVYNYDGPGLDENVLETPGYSRICQRTNTYVPQSSIVGMLLGHKEKYTIVHSSQTGPLQHILYSWDIERKGFACLETVTNGSKFVDNTLRDWLSNCDKTQREKFADALYRILADTNAVTFRDLGENWSQSAKSMLQSIVNMDPETRRLVTATLKSLMTSALNEFSGGKKQIEE